MSGIFISYRRDDTKHPAGRLYGDLADHFGKDRVFRDTDAMEPGVKYASAIRDFIGSCDALVAVIGREWLDAVDEQGRKRLRNPRDVLRREIVSALEAGKLVIPVLVDDAEMPPVDALPKPLATLADYQAHNMRDDRWDHDVELLVKALEKVVRRKPAGVVTPAAAVTDHPVPEPPSAPPPATVPVPAAVPSTSWRSGGYAERPPDVQETPALPGWLKVGGPALVVLVLVVVGALALGGGGDDGDDTGPGTTAVSGASVPPSTGVPGTQTPPPTGAPAGETSVTLSSSTGPRGGAITVRGSGFEAGETVEIRFHIEQLATATADGSGAFADVVIRVPDDAFQGFPYTVSAVGRRSSRSGHAPFRVN